MADVRILIGQAIGELKLYQGLWERRAPLKVLRAAWDRVNHALILARIAAGLPEGGTPTEQQELRMRSLDDLNQDLGARP